jgi:hypothetical protein
MNTVKRMDNRQSTATWMEDAAFAPCMNAADHQAQYATQPDGTSQQGRATQQGEASATTQALMDCYSG